MPIPAVCVCLLIALGAGLGAGEAPSPTPGHRFRVGVPQVCAFVTEQEDVLRTAGDELAFENRLRWEFLLLPTAVAADEAVLRITFSRIEARLTGPGAEAPTPDPRAPPGAGAVPRPVPRAVLARFASDEPATAADPLFGHYAALVGRPLELTVDPRTGVVSRIEGLAAVIAAVAERSAETGGGEPDEAVVAEARRRFDEAALCRIWSRILQVPSTGTELLPLDLPGAPPVRRRWDGATWTLELPEDARIEVILHDDPTPETLVVAGLSGRGGVDLRDGILREVRGEISLDLGGTASTQEVGQRQTITWHCVLDGPRAAP